MHSSYKVSIIGFAAALCFWMFYVRKNSDSDSATTAVSSPSFLALHGLQTRPEWNGKLAKQISAVVLSADKCSFRIPVQLVDLYDDLLFSFADAPEVLHLQPNPSPPTPFLVNVENATPMTQHVLNECTQLLMSAISLSSLSSSLTQQLNMHKNGSSGSSLYCLASSLNAISNGTRNVMRAYRRNAFLPTRKPPGFFVLCNLFHGIGGVQSPFLLSDDEKVQAVRNAAVKAHGLAFNLLHELDLQQIKDSDEKTEFVQKLASAVVDAGDELRWKGYGAASLSLMIEYLARFDGTENEKAEWVAQICGEAME